MQKFLAYLALGSNVGDRMKNLDEARKGLEAADVEIVKASRVYETEPFYKEDGGQWFLNQAVQTRTSLTPRELLDAIQTVERALGRLPKPSGQHAGPRCIDIDILLYGDEAIYLPDLQIPHPRLSERRFMLVPLAEIHPEFQKILSECKDGHKVVSFS